MKLRNVLLSTLIAGTCFNVTSVNAGSDPFIGEVQWFAGNFAPRGWAECDGQLLQISQHTALFSILGTTYGGDGRVTFALPDARGRVLIHEGQGPGLTPRRLGERGGAETVTLTTNQIPNHSHTLRASSGSATKSTPAGNVLASTGRTRLYDSSDSNVDMDVTAITAAGGGQAHNNMQPYNTLTCIIALVGVYPSRN